MRRAKLMRGQLALRRPHQIIAARVPNEVKRLGHKARWADVDDENARGERRKFEL